jgi:uncharacterized protein YpmS
MADKVKEAVSHNYDPVNQYIDEQARLKRSASTWRYAKAISLILVAIGILFLLLAWAYNIFKKPNPELVKKLNEVDKKFEQSQSLDRTQEKLVDGEIINYNSTTHRFLSTKKDDYFITTRIVYNTTKDLLEGNKPKEITCYIDKGNVVYEYDTLSDSNTKNLQLMSLSLDQALSYKQFCKYDFNE